MFENTTIKKRPKGKEVKEDDYFIVAKDFKNARFKLKINQIQVRETTQETRRPTKKFSGIDCTSRCMYCTYNENKKTYHSDLMSETLNQIKFPAKGSDIKKRIESLIDCEYIERHEDNPNVQLLGVIFTNHFV